ncbi:ROK family protein [Streptomyces sp. NBC_00878]|uniref:ROK family protein n=1 Tax=Streptomyces sp. NBC_00878 TaxID=2975854 RepID=UPI00225AB3D2|nr:ROK family protein [Streptomyces sp. NBC_00878]MCX4908837.1 ROK family protein [Streptomyces sp. NBC_00878]
MATRAGRTGRTGSQASSGDLLELVRSGRATTRGALQQVTGLSRATVGQRLDRLFRAGWLREGAAGPVDSPLGGRPSVRLEFDDAHAVVLAADLDTRHARAAVLSLTGELLAEHTGALLIEEGPDAVLGELGRWFAELLEKAGHRADEVCGIGLAVPGPVDSDTGRVVQPPIMPGWDGYDIRGRLTRAFAEHTGAEAVPVLVDNDANLMAYGEQRTGHPDCSAFVLVKVSTGIGAGVVVGGSIYRGIDGGAGDIGHIRVPEGADALCRCGSYGCLAAVASGGAVARRLAEKGVPAASGSDVRDLLASGHPGAAALAREAGRHVGDVLATVVTLLNPGVLMIAGDLAGTPFLTGVRELLYQRALPRSTARLDVVTSRLGERAGLVGAGALVVEHLYAPERVEERLRAMGV